MKTVWPHEAFRLDFDQLAEEGRIQEKIHPVNVGEYAITKKLHQFFNRDILSLFAQDDWVFDAAAKFADRYAFDYFSLLRLQGEETFRTQQALTRIRDDITEFLAQAHMDGYVRNLRNLTKLRDFADLIDMRRLPTLRKGLAIELRERAIDQESLHVQVGLRMLRENYERAFPRVFFVVRRALTVTWRSRRTRSNDSLLQPSDYVDWYQNNAPANHFLSNILFNDWNFYRTARNVASHHIGLEYQPESDSIILHDRNSSLSIHIDTFFQRNRILNYFCEMGTRGILAGFTERERGPVSNQLIKEYRKTFPNEWAGGEKGSVRLYPDE